MARPSSSGARTSWCANTAAKSSRPDRCSWSLLGNVPLVGTPGRLPRGVLGEDALHALARDNRLRDEEEPEHRDVLGDTPPGFSPELKLIVRADRAFDAVQRRVDTGARIPTAVATRPAVLRGGDLTAIPTTPERRLIKRQPGLLQRWEACSVLGRLPPSAEALVDHLDAERAVVGLHQRERLVVLTVAARLKLEAEPFAAGAGQHPIRALPPARLLQKLAGTRGVIRVLHDRALDSVADRRARVADAVGNEVRTSAREDALDELFAIEAVHERFTDVRIEQV